MVFPRQQGLKLNKSRSFLAGIKKGSDGISKTTRIETQFARRGIFPLTVDLMVFPRQQGLKQTINNIHLTWCF